MAAPPPSNFDGNQVLQHAFDEAEGRLRVDATLSPGGTSEVIIDHADDSIRLGDGTNLVTTTTVGSDVGLDVNVVGGSMSITIDGVTSPTVSKVSAPLANTEYSFVISSTTKKVKFRSGRKGKIQYTFTSGQSGTTFFTVDKGDQEEFTSLDLSANLTVYFQVDTAAEGLEVLSWD